MHESPVVRSCRQVSWQKSIIGLERGLTSGGKTLSTRIRLTSTGAQQGDQSLEFEGEVLYDST